MSLDFRQVQDQVRNLGESALLREHRVKVERDLARALLESNANEFDRLLQKVQLVVRNYDPTLRCAIPVNEPLNQSYPMPLLPSRATLVAADGSQIAPDRNAEVNYCLVNVGAIQMCLGTPDPPVITVESQLMYDELLYSGAGMLTDEELALARDLSERSLLAKLARTAPPPVITFTDGPMELWGAKDNSNAGDYQQKLDAYAKVLGELCSLSAVTAGYVDKPAASMVIRLLEIAMLPENELNDVKKKHPLPSASDRDLFRELLSAGERSAVFRIQSKSVVNYKDELALHFFYLNVGRPDYPWLARVEIPQWVVDTAGMLDLLHAVLIQQVRIMGSRAYPYLLHRAHEAAVVSLEEKDHVTQMIVMELRKRGVRVDDISQKQAVKNLRRRMRY